MHSCVNRLRQKKIQIQQRNDTNWQLSRHLIPTRPCWPGAQPALHFGGGEFSWNFIRWRHHAYSTVVQLVRKWSQIKFSSQHFWKWELLSFNQGADRTIRTEEKLVAQYKHLILNSTSAIMALVWQTYGLLVNLPNFSSCFSVVNVWLLCRCHVVAPAILQSLIVPLCSPRSCCVVLAVS